MSKFKYIQPISEGERLEKRWYRPLKQDVEIYRTTSFDIQKKFRKNVSLVNQPVNSSDDQPVKSSDNHPVNSSDDQPVKSSENVAPNAGAKSNTRLLVTVTENDRQICPICTLVFQRYSLHKARRLENQCCICWEIFESEEILYKHVEEFAKKKICCSCKFHKKIDSGNFENNLKEFHKHIKKCRPKKPDQ